MELTGKIPQLRYDLQAIAFNQDGTDFVHISDPMGAASPDMQVTREFFTFLSFIEENFTFEDLKTQVGDELLYNLLVQSISTLDNSGYMVSEKFFEKFDAVKLAYEYEVTRPMLTAGKSFPANAEDFIVFMDKMFENTSNSSATQPKALILPHIDFNIGQLTQSVYANAYSKIKNSDSEVFVVLGTSHKINTDYFMLSDKNYQTPLGEIEIDRTLLSKLINSLGESATIDNFAHKVEHSIEFQSVILKYLLRDKNIKILPILIGSFHNFIDSKISPLSEEKLKKAIETIRAEIESYGKKVTFIASVDFSHFGYKFGDDFDAFDFNKQVEESDKELINAIEQGNSEEFFKLIADDGDMWKVCGSSPIFALMNICNPTSGKLIDYAIWNETETKSAVSFASIELF